MFDICNTCYKKATTYSCLTCHTFKIKFAINELQRDIDNNIYKCPLVLINDNYRYIENIIDFKGVEHKIIKALPRDVICCIADKNFFDFKEVYAI